MTIVKIDKKWRIVLPKSLRKNVKLRQNQHLRLHVEKDTFVFRPLKTSDSRNSKDPFLNDIINNPLHVNPKKIKKLDLEKLEEEMWLS
ncbi:MAG: AbrB/MazE/SpoVT family DNA-binding domain-containing protein [Candidatus Aenigmatarchaeota archaeon]